jgi:alkylhydroperoxidase family enzyme
VADRIDDLRASLAATEPAPPELAAYLEKVRTRAYAITDGEVEALKDAGFSEDVIFEQTVAVAIEQGLRRLDAASRAIAG